MPTTTTYGLRYPASTDPADVPSDLQKLASDVDVALGVKDPTGLVAGEANVWDGAKWVRSSTVKLGSGSLAGYPWKNADIDPAAAIAYTKLALAGMIKDADIAAAAAIAIAKLAGYPADGSKFLAGDASWKSVVGIPTGLIAPYAGAAAPGGWLLCDGSNVNRTTFAALFAVLGTVYGAGDGSTTFGLPDLRGRVPVGKAASGTFAALAAVGGEAAHVLVTAEMPSHGHSFTGNALPTHQHNFSGNALPGHGHTFSGNQLPDHTHTMTPRNEGAGDFKTDSFNSGSGGTQNLVRSINSLGGTTGTWQYVNTGSAQQGLVPTGTVNGASAGTPSGSIDPQSAGTPTGTIGTQGGDGGHNNLQPYQVVNYMVKT